MRTVYVTRAPVNRPLVFAPAPAAAPGREGLFALIKGSPVTLKYEPGLVLANEQFVMLHGRFSGTGLPRNWVAADIVRVQDGLLAEHWDVLQDEATRAESLSGRPMFGTAFAP